MSHEALNDEQFADHLDLYHHTSPEAAESISKEGFRPGNVFFSDTPHGYWGRAGAAAIHVRVPVEQAKDAGVTTTESGEKEQLYTVPAQHIRSEHIQGVRAR
jgi:RNA:NAD 2'-phosphotransferase (TPT1/KptA family)